MNLDLRKNALDSMANRGLFNSADGWVFMLSTSDDEYVNEEQNCQGTENFGEQRNDVEVGNNDMEMKMSVVDEDPASRKRKWEYYSSMLDWITKVSKDPCNRTIGSLPEVDKWKSYGCDQLWKQVLLVRDTMLIRRNADSSNPQMISQVYIIFFNHVCI